MIAGIDFLDLAYIVVTQLVKIFEEKLTIQEQELSKVKAQRFGLTILFLPFINTVAAFSAP